MSNLSQNNQDSDTPHIENANASSLVASRDTEKKFYFPVKIKKNKKV